MLIQQNMTRGKKKKQTQRETVWVRREKKKKKERKKALSGTWDFSRPGETSWKRPLHHASPRSPHWLQPDNVWWFRAGARRLETALHRFLYQQVSRIGPAKGGFTGGQREEEQEEEHDLLREEQLPAPVVPPGHLGQWKKRPWQAAWGGWAWAAGQTAAPYSPGSPETPFPLGLLQAFQ